MMRHPRGSALILAIVVLLVIAVIGAGMLRFAAREVAGATAAARTEALDACAEAGRQVIMSKFRAVGTSPTSLPVLNVKLDQGGSVQVIGGHFDTDDVQISQVTYLPDAAFGVDRGSVQTLTNRITVSGLGSKPIKAIVHCQVGGDGTPGSGRQLEIEYGLRFGI
ncbi:MAG: hypothetical protein QM767_10825 [Anaeromyxobacter sp.]